MRCFISINFPDAFKEEIKKIQNILPDFIKNKTNPENLHLTLKFLGEISNEKFKLISEKLKEINFKRFFLNSGEIGLFDNNDKGVVWISLKNSEELQKKIDDSLKEIFPTEKRFMSHLTIARTKEIKDKKEFLEFLKTIKLNSFKFEVKEFYLMESKLTTQGSIYKIVEKYALD